MTIGSAAFASRCCRIPHVYYVHEFGREDHGFNFDLGSGLTYTLMDKLSHRIVANSNAVARKLQKEISSEKIRIVSYAVEIPEHDPVPPISDGAFRLILVGRMIPSKGQEDAIRALSMLVQKGLTVQLLLLGTAGREYQRVLHNMAERLGVSQHVQFADFTHDPFSQILRSHLTLMCSRNEAFGRVTVEAMKLGKPVVGANSGGTSELIQHGFNGLLYKPGDVQELSQNIETFYQNRDLLAQMGRNAREWSHSAFTTAKQVAGLVSVFEEVLSEFRGIEYEGQSSARPSLYNEGTSPIMRRGD